MAAMEAAGQRKTSFRASSVQLVPILLSEPGGSSRLLLAFASHGEPGAPSMRLARPSGPNSRTSRRPMRVRIDVAPSCAFLRTTGSGAAAAPDRHPYDVYASLNGS